MAVADELVLRGETALELAVPEDRARIVASGAKARAVPGQTGAQRAGELNRH